MGLEAAAGPAARTGGGDRRALGHCRVECARRWGSCRCDFPGLQDYSTRHAPRRAPCGVSGSWRVFGADFGFVAAHSDGRVWPAEVGLSLALSGGVSAESLDVLTEKTSEFLIHSFRVLQVRYSD